MPYRAFKGSVCFVLNPAGDQILLLQRNHDPFKDKWDGMQGLAEFGETPIETACREVFEESGLTVTNPAHRGHLLLYNLETEVVIVADLIVATCREGEPGSSEEGQPVWMSLAGIADVDLVGFVHTTLPLVLTPDTFLTGTIQHLNSGDAVHYDLMHYGIQRADHFTL